MVRVFLKFIMNLLVAFDFLFICDFDFLPIKVETLH